MTRLLRDAREDRGVGVRELARRCGVSAPTVVGWERSEAEDVIQVGTLRRALSALGDDVELTIRLQRPEPRTLDRREQRLGLELHRKVAGKLVDDPALVLDAARDRLDALRRSVRGGAIAWVDEWDRLIGRQDLGQLVETFLGTSQHHIDMRSVSPFDGLLTQEERREVLARSMA